MRILINSSNLKAGGGLQVADSFLSLLKDFSQHIFWVVLSSQLEYLQSLLSTYSNVNSIVYNTDITTLGIIRGENKYLDQLVAEYQIEAVFSVFGPPLWRPKVPHIVGFARPQLIYSDSPFFSRMNWLKRSKSWIIEYIKLHNFKICSDAFITEAQDVTNRLSVLLPNAPKYTITNNINQVFLFESQWSRDIVLSPFKGFTLLTISANHQHKNLGIIPLVIKELRTLAPNFSFRFVVTLTEKELSIDGEYKPYLILLGKTQISQCPFLYEQADAMFLPTLLECFSASYPEAMYMKCPILTSDLPFAHSLCGESAIYFDPLSPKDIAQKILRLAESNNLQASLKANGIERLKLFDSFEERARKYIQVIEHCKIDS